MKKLLSLALSLALVLSFAACSNSASSTPDSSSAEQSSVSQAVEGLWATATYTENAEVGEGEKTVEMTVTAEDKSIVITVKTDAETVGDMLRETSVATGSEGNYGLFVDTVNGIKADWDTDGTYWGFYVDGEFSSVGVDGVDIPTDGSLNIAFNLEKDNG